MSTVNANNGRRFPAAVVLQAIRQLLKSSGWTGTGCWLDRSRSSWLDWTGEARGSEVKGTVFVLLNLWC